MTDFDFDTHYRAANYGGIAFYAIGYEKIKDEDYDWSGIEFENRERVRCVMVGDDHVFTFDVEDLTPLEDDEYCPECGQIGCKAYG